MNIKEELHNEFKRFFKLFNRNYNIGNIEDYNSINVRRITNAIQQIDQYRTAINDYINELGEKETLAPSEAEAILKLVLEFIALADSLSRNSEDFLLLSKKETANYCRRFVVFIEENTSGFKSAEDESVLLRMEILLKDIFTTIDRWE